MVDKIAIEKNLLCCKHMLEDRGLTVVGIFLYGSQNYNLDYEPLEIEGNSIDYPWTCPDCHASGKEWYDLEFSEQELIEEGGE